LNNNREPERRLYAPFLQHCLPLLSNVKYRMISVAKVGWNWVPGPKKLSPYVSGPQIY